MDENEMGGAFSKIRLKWLRVGEVVRHLGRMMTLLLALALARSEGYSQTPDAKMAMERLGASDTLLRRGRLGLAYAGYLELVRLFPTWWLPSLKAAVAARALGLPDETVIGYIERTQDLAPSVIYVELLQTALGISPVGVGARGEAGDRARLIRGLAASKSGRWREAIAEYRWILERKPGCVVARWSLASALARTGQSSEASAILRESAGSSLFPPRWRAEAERVLRNNERSR